MFPRASGAALALSLIPSSRRVLRTRRGGSLEVLPASVTGSCLGFRRGTRTAMIPGVAEAPIHGMCSMFMIRSLLPPPRVWFPRRVSLLPAHPRQRPPSAH